jgi:putative transposase
MEKRESQTSKEATWRNHLARHASSGKSIAAFCRDEAISAGNFHAWRTKLTNGANEHAARPAPQATFIDLGAVNSAVGSRATEHALAPLAMSGIDIRIDLGGGVVLTIARR